MTQTAGPLSENVKLDDAADIATVYGIKIHGDLLRALGEPTRPGWWLRIVKVADGVATVEQRLGEDGALLALIEAAEQYQQYHDEKFYAGLAVKPTGLRPAIATARAVLSTRAAGMGGDFGGRRG